MTTSAPSARRSDDELVLPDSVRRHWIPLGCVLLTLVFFVSGLPTDRFGAIATAKLRQSLGADLRVGSLGLGLAGMLPALDASQVHARWGDGAEIDLSRARVRPALSLGWLRGRPAFVVDLEGPLGNAKGTAYAGAEPGFDGTISDVDLAKLPLGSRLPPGTLDGRASAVAVLRLSPGGPLGRIELDARDGSLSLPALPVAIPFATLRGAIEMSEQSSAAIDSLSLDGPMLSATVKGTVGRAPYLSAMPLALDVKLDVKEASLRPMLQSAGMRVDANGGATLRVSGSVGAPSVQ